MDKEKKTGGSTVPLETEDLLGRDEYADCLMQLLCTYETYYSAENKKRGTDNEGFVIGISSDCGTGKTTFLEVLRKRIEKVGYSYIKYNAWKCDYSDNALESLLFTILGEKALEEALKDEAFDLKVLNLICGIRANFSIGITSTIEKLLALSLQSDSKKDVKDFLSKVMFPKLQEEHREETPTAQLIIKAFASEFKSQEESIRALQELLGKAYTKSQDDQTSNGNPQSNYGNPSRPLVVIIDELDRCRPSFAVQTLEIIKHIFCMKGVVFVVAFDLLQLSSTVKSFYGENFDAVGYLNRFFDYMSYMPDGDKDKFIGAMLDRYSLTMEKLGISENTDSPEEKDKKENIEDIWEGKVRKICDMFSLSLRDIKLVLAAFERLNKTSLKDHKDINAKILYLYFLALQYRRPEIIMGALRGIRTSSDRVGEAAPELKGKLTDNPIPFWYKEGSKKRIEEIEKSYRSLLLSRLDIRSIRHDYHIEDDDYETLYEIRKSNMCVQEITHNTISEISNFGRTGDFNSISFVFYKTDLDYILGERYITMRPLEYIQTNIELRTSKPAEVSSAESEEESDAGHGAESVNEPADELAAESVRESAKESADESATYTMGNPLSRICRNARRMLKGK